MLKRLIGIIGIGLVMLTGRLAAQEPTHPVIDPQNASHLTSVATFGTGAVSPIITTATQVVVGGDYGIWLYDNGNLAHAPQWLPTHTTGITTLAISPDGRYLATGSHDRTVQVWDMATHTLHLSLSGHNLGVTSVVFSDTFIASGSQDGWLRLHDSQTGAYIGALRHNRPIIGLALQPDSLLSATSNGVITSWELDNRQARFVVETDGAELTAFAANATTIATGADDGTIRLYNATDGAFLSTLTAHTGPITALAFHPDGETLISASQDSTLRLWDMDSGVEQGLYQGHSGGVLGVAFQQDGKRFISTGRDRRLHVWDTRSLTAIDVINQGHLRAVRAVVFSPDSRLLASGSSDGTIHLWDTQSLSFSQTLTAGSAVYSLAFSPNGDRLAAGEENGMVRLWDTTTWTETDAVANHTAAVNALAFNFNGRLIASAADDGLVVLWDTRQKRDHARLREHGDTVYDLAFSADGLTLLSVGGDRVVRFWDVESGSIRGRVGIFTVNYRSIAYSPDGTTIALGSPRGSFLLLTADGTASVPALQGMIGDLQFSPDGRLLAVAGAPNTVLLWSLQHNFPANVLTTHRAIVRSVAFSPDGTLMATASEDQTVQLWAVRSE